MGGCSLGLAVIHELHQSKFPNALGRDLGWFIVRSGWSTPCLDLTWLPLQDIQTLSRTFGIPILYDSGNPKRFFDCRKEFYLSPAGERLYQWSLLHKRETKRSIRHATIGNWREQMLLALHLRDEEHRKARERELDRRLREMKQLLLYEN